MSSGDDFVPQLTYSLKSSYLTTSETPDASTDPAQRLLDAAGPVFARRGFDRTPVREIAKLAEVNVAAVSYYYGDKMGLYRAVITSIRDKRTSQFPAPEVGTAPAEETLQRLIHTLLSRLLTGDETSWESMLMAREMEQPTEALDELIQEYFKPLYDAICQTISELVDAQPVVESDVVEDAPSNCGDALDSAEALHTETLHSRTSVSNAKVANASDADWRAEALVPQITLGVIGQCLHYRIGQPVIERLIAPSVRNRHYDLESLCRHITATTLAVCGRGNLIDYRLKLETIQTKTPKECR